MPQKPIDALQKFGIGMHVGLFWLRGKARVEGDYVILDPKEAEPYYIPSASQDLLFALAGLGRPIQPKEAVAFVEQFGLLERSAVELYLGEPHLESAPYKQNTAHTPWKPEELREKFRDWEGVSAWLLDTLLLHVRLQKAINGGKAAREELRAWGYRFFTDKRRDEWGTIPDSEIFTLASHGVASRVNRGLEGVEMGIVAQSDLKKAGALKSGPLGDYVFAPRVSTLFELAFYQLGGLIVRHEPLDECLECGRVFPVKDKRMEYCSSKCAGRVRSRRHIEKKRKGGA